MLNFFQNIFEKVVSLTANVLIAIGLFSTAASPSAASYSSISVNQTDISKGEVVAKTEIGINLVQNAAIQEKATERTALKQEKDILDEKVQSILNNTNLDQGQKLEQQMKVYDEYIQKRREITKSNELAKYIESNEEIDQQPRLVFLKDNLGNNYEEDQNYIGSFNTRLASGFSMASSPLCLQEASVSGDCPMEVINWVNSRSIKIGNKLDVSFDAFDANGDDILFFVSYGSREDWGYGTMEVLQSWQTNNRVLIPITKELFERTLNSNLAWRSFSSSANKDTQVVLDNSGELNINICFNNKAERMQEGEQFPFGCVLFKYFILKPNFSDLKIF